MKGNKILIINGHPDKESYNFGLAEAYRKGAESTNASVDIINVRDLEFNPNLQFGYRKRTELEPDLKKSIDKIKESDHIVWVFPMWWYGYPAILKGFIDRTFLPGIFFEFVPGKPLPRKLLKEKTGRIIITADTPKWYNILFMKSPAINQFKKGTLQFCGINPVKVTYISTIKNSNDEFRNSWLTKVEKLGNKLK
ncbi:NAD(P)H-dependent oxidoreductase [Salibacter halophilus]|uniref:NAD(P)H-dependent oxidoreductase n=1 Tax=Salibacter halophilus TaxID=1803916 RepID=A0A6N6M6Z8_9FLAO|nr:NAD(P)H-dependent oxidoreductase [Salibacter halophilus]KAB1065578.1 NAD(P)H-dependent oxidoreductase [Salibacter halophilus]